MNTICVKYRGHLAALTGIAEETVEAQDVEGALRAVRKRHGRKAEKAARAMLIAVNGESIQLLQRYKTQVNEGDAVSFFPLCAGG
jgi:molybdopterin synthase sulfur carrier subunit